jgi:hypothetical protein
LSLAYFAWTGPEFGSAEMERAARSWTQEGRIAHVYSDRTGDSAHVAPLYPILLGTIYRLVGWESPAAGWAQSSIAIVATAVNVV